MGTALIVTPAAVDRFFRSLRGDFTWSATPIHDRLRWELHQQRQREQIAKSMAAFSALGKSLQSMHAAMVRLGAVTATPPPKRGRA